MKKGAVLSLVLVLCLLLSGCSKTFSGLYLREDGQETLEFFKDGTVEAIYDGMYFDGTYEKIDKNKYEIFLDALFFRTRYVAVIDGDMLELYSEGTGKTYYYYLVK